MAAVEAALRNALAGIDSDKQKERTAGLDSLKSILSEPRNAERLDNGSWKTLLVRVAACVEKEKSVFFTKFRTKKGKGSPAKTSKTSTAETKMEKSLIQLSHDFKWFCQIAENKLNMAVNKIVEHMLRVLPDHGDLFKPLAVNYTKTLRQILSRRPYREHLKPSLWDALVRLCCQVLVAESASGFVVDVDGDMKKSTPDQSPGSSSFPNDHASSQDRHEMARIFALLVVSCPTNLTTMAMDLLHFCADFFASNPQENSCHLWILSAMNHVLFETAPDLVFESVELLTKMVPHLLCLWDTRSQAVKIQVLLALRLYVAFTTSYELDESFSKEFKLNMVALYNRLQGQVAKIGGFGPLSTFGGGSIGLGSKTDPYGCGVGIGGSVLPRSFLASVSSSSKSIIEDNMVAGDDFGSWIFLELTADIFWHTHSLMGTSLVSDVDEGDSLGETVTKTSRAKRSAASTARARKRMKQADVFGDMKRVLESTTSSSKDGKIATLQLLIFMFQRHGYAMSISGDKGDRSSGTAVDSYSLFEIMVELIQTDDADLQKWAFYAISAFVESVNIPPLEPTLTSTSSVPVPPAHVPTNTSDTFNPCNSSFPSSSPAVPQQHFPSSSASSFASPLMEKVRQTAIHRVGSPTAGDAAFACLEAMYLRGFMSRRDASVFLTSAMKTINEESLGGGVSGASGAGGMGGTGMLTKGSLKFATTVFTSLPSSTMDSTSFASATKSSADSEGTNNNDDDDVSESLSLIFRDVCDVIAAKLEQCLDQRQNLSHLVGLLPYLMNLFGPLDGGVGDDSGDDYEEEALVFKTHPPMSWSFREEHLTEWHFEEASKQCLLLLKNEYDGLLDSRKRGASRQDEDSNQGDGKSSALLKKAYRKRGRRRSRNQRIHLDTTGILDRLRRHVTLVHQHFSKIDGVERNTAGVTGDCTDDAAVARTMLVSVTFTILCLGNLTRFNPELVQLTGDATPPSFRAANSQQHAEEGLASQHPHTQQPQQQQHQRHVHAIRDRIREMVHFTSNVIQGMELRAKASASSSSSSSTPSTLSQVWSMIDTFHSLQPCWATLGNALSPLVGEPWHDLWCSQNVRQHKRKHSGFWPLKKTDLLPLMDSLRHLIQISTELSPTKPTTLKSRSSSTSSSSGAGGRYISRRSGSALGGLSGSSSSSSISGFGDFDDFEQVKVVSVSSSRQAFSMPSVSVSGSQCNLQAEFFGTGSVGAGSGCGCGVAGSNVLSLRIKTKIVCLRTLTNLWSAVFFDGGGGQIDEDDQMLCATNEDGSGGVQDGLQRFIIEMLTEYGGDAARAADSGSSSADGGGGNPMNEFGVMSSEWLYWLAHVAPTLSSGRCMQVLQYIEALLEADAFKKNTWAWTFAVRCMKFLLKAPCMIPSPSTNDPTPDGDDSSDDREECYRIYGRFLQFLVNKVEGSIQVRNHGNKRSQQMHWRLSLELGMLLLSYLRADPQQEHIDRISGIQQEAGGGKRDADDQENENTLQNTPHHVIFSLLRHDVFLVRLLLSKAISVFFGEIYAEEDHADVLQDIHEALSFDERATEDEAMMLDDVKNDSGVNVRRYEVVVTITLTYANIAAVTMSQREAALKFLIEMAAGRYASGNISNADTQEDNGCDDGLVLDVVNAGLTFLAHTLSCSLSDLVHELLPTLIVHTWRNNPFALPHRLFGFDRAADFFDEYSEVFVERFLRDGDLGGLRRLVRECGLKDVSALMRGNIPAALAQVLLLRALTKRTSQADPRREVIGRTLQFFVDAFGNESVLYNEAMKFGVAERTATKILLSFDPVESEQQPSIMSPDTPLQEMIQIETTLLPSSLSALIVSADGRSGSTVLYDEICAWNALDLLAKMVLNSGDGTETFWHPARVQRVLEHMHREVDCLHFTASKFRWLLAMRLWVSKVPEHFMHPLLFQWSTQKLLHLVPSVTSMDRSESDNTIDETDHDDENRNDDAIRIAVKLLPLVSCIITFLCKRAERSAPLLLRENLVLIVPAIFQQIQQLRAVGGNHRRALKGVAASQLRALKEIIGQWQTLEDAPEEIKLCFMLVDTRVLTECFPHVEATTEALDLETIVKLLSIPQSSSGGWLRALTLLRKNLSMVEFHDHLESQHPWMIGSLISRLLGILRDNFASDKVVVEVGHCLGKLACFCRPGIGVDVGDLDGNFMFITKKPPKHCDRQTQVTDKHMGHIAALEELKVALLSMDTEIVRVAERTMRSLLATTLGHQVYGECPADLRAFIDLFKSEKEPLTERTQSGVVVRVVQPSRTYSKIKRKNIKEVITSCASKSTNWKEGTRKPFDEWIVSLANSILTSFESDDFFVHLRLILEYRPRMAERLLPHIVHASLNTYFEIYGSPEPDIEDDDEFVNVPETLSVGFQHFFQYSELQNPRAIQCLLKVVEFLRTQPNPHAGTDFENNEWLRLDYLAVCQAAFRVGSYSSSLLFLEIALEYHRRGGQPSSVSSSKIKQYITNFDALQEVIHVDPSAFSNFLLDLYQNIDDPDGFDGITSIIDVNFESGFGTGFGNVTGSLMMRKHEHDGAWQKMFSLYETQLQMNAIFGGNVANNENALALSSTSRLPGAPSPHASSSLHAGLLQSMNKMGLYNIVRTYVGGLDFSHPELMSQHVGTNAFDNQSSISEMQYESMWRNGIWSIDTSITRNGSAKAKGKQSHLYQCLRAFHRQEWNGADQSVEHTFLRLLRDEESHPGSIRRFIKSDSSLLLSLNVFAEIGEMVNLLNDSFRTNVTAGGSKIRSHLELLLDLWDKRLRMLYDGCGFSEGLESILACRSACFRELSAAVSWSSEDRALHRMASSQLSQHLVEYGRLARKGNNLQIAQYALQQLKYSTLSEVGRDAFSVNDGLLIKVRGQLQLLKVLWNQGDRMQAIHGLKTMLYRLYSVPQPGAVAPLFAGFQTEKGSLKTSLLCQLGLWISEARLENAQTILQEFFEKAIDVERRESAPGSSPSTTLGRAYFYVAKYADAQYEEMVNNNLLEASQELLSHKMAELKEYEDYLARLKAAAAAAAQQNGKPERDRDQLRLLHAISKLRKQIDLDRSEANRVRRDRMTFLSKAVEGYLQALAYGDKWDLSVYRLVALWLANWSVPQVNSTMKRYLHAIPSRKFLVLIYQLSARMSMYHPSPPPTATKGNSPRDSASESPHFQQILTSLVQRMATEHPHHCLYQIIALKNGSDPADYGGSIQSSAMRKSRSRSSTPVGDENKTVAAAKDMLDRLRASSSSSSKRLGDIVNACDSLSEAYRELAFVRIDTKAKASVYRIERKFRLMRLCSGGAGTEELLRSIPVSTIELPVDPTCEYKDFVGIKGFVAEFRLVGGINKPRLIQCEGTDGRMYRQLVKGQDDLRQDAVLAKIFTVVNVLLRKNLETRKRDLHVRTYKVIPLSPRAGLLEWVENTTAIGEYLIAAHPRYNPKDFPPTDCRKRMNMEHERPESTPQSRYQVYQQIVKKFRPVFRFFFQEHYRDPEAWFQRKLTYVRSVASTSITGFAVGLGDRHAQNILIDKETAELVHIDLGIAFDQGKLLSTPELVPFRLTRDIVDGMGITGIEGSFRRCCEEMLSVLRAEADIFLTILDVFRYDPLFQWRTSLLKAQQVQNVDRTSDADSHINTWQGGSGAGAANGNGGGKSSADEANKEAERAMLNVRKKLLGTMSVQCQVSELIQTAMDEKNLARMFPGW
ncbi:hypothetical protein HK102_008284 [Quaeritorhiza haematococci]|nr:hypothetical protein HK102_008284 [Quaeritorhiza haematococci]